MATGTSGRILACGGGIRAVMMTGVALTALGSSGCYDARDAYGKTWYIDGVGNWGFGVTEVPQGLQRAGYRGHVEDFRWSLTLNPIIDQTFRIFAKGGGGRLAGVIRDHLRRYPNTDVNLIGLSAGSGVAIWAAEELRPPYKIRNVVLLGSSLSNRYDLRPALANITGEIIVYCSASDTVLQGPAKLLGTIDGTFDDSAGLTGMIGPGARSGRVRNIPWNSGYAQLGWTGGHTDCTSMPFVQREIARWIVGGSGGPVAKPTAPPIADTFQPGTN